MDMVKNYTQKGDSRPWWITSLKMDLDIFLADVDGTLQHDKKNGLKRYHGKWSKEKDKLGKIISTFRQQIAESESPKEE